MPGIGESPTSGGGGPATMSCRHQRQMELVNNSKLEKTRISIIGAGAIGSIVAVSLAKMGCTSLTVWDFDTVEEVNLPNQWFRPKDIGQPKAEALKAIVADWTDVRIDARNERYTGQPIDKGIVISAVDSMKARKTIWTATKYKSKHPRFIDTRMAAEVGQVYFVNPIDPDDVRFYEESLFDDDEGLQERCTARAIMYTPLGVAAIVSGKVKKFVMDQACCRFVTRDFRLSILDSKQ